MYKCINCNYKGKDITDKGFCPVCGDKVSTKVKLVEEIKLDLNNDNKIDHEDASIAGKVLNEVKKQKVTRRGKR